VLSKKWGFFLGKDLNLELFFVRGGDFAAPSHKKRSSACSSKSNLWILRIFAFVVPFFDLLVKCNLNGNFTFIAMTDFWTEILDFAATTAAEIGMQLLKDFRQVQAEVKADGSLVTKADQWADAAIRAAIARQFPEHGVLTEELEHQFPDTDWCWVIDPIDGTTNFARGIPFWAISLGLLYKGTPVFGYIYVPCLNHAFHGFWSGESGLSLPTGAFLNEDLIQSNAAEPSKSRLFSLCARSLDVLRQPFPCKIRMLGVASYNLLTVGIGSTVGAVEATPKVWDIAAAWAIAQAAGAVWVSLAEQPIFPLRVGENYRDRCYPTLVVSQPEFVDTFLPLVQCIS
jgi:myo-inositol-1(or 4)-monophosphatase